MVSISSLISRCFQERLVNKAELLFDTVDSSKVNTARRILLFLRNIKCSYYPLLERCNKVLTSSVSHLDLESISKILSLYQSLQFHSFEFIEVSRRRLMEMIPGSSGYPESFVRLFATLGPVAGPEIKKHRLEASITPSEICILVSALSMLPFPHFNETAISRIEAVLPQCDSKELSDFVSSLMRWIQNDHKCLANTTRKQLNLLQKLDHWGHHRLQQSNSLDLLWEELKSLKGEWLHESFVEESVAALQRFADEIDCTNVAKIASFLSKTNYLSTLLLDRIASVVVQQIEKIHPFSILAITLPFSVLNYDPPQRDEFFGACVQCLNSYVVLPSTLSARVQFRLMELNRAVCLECPEFQIPWFHDRFCRGHYNKDIDVMNGAQQQIYKMLAEVLGGLRCVKASGLSTYYHTVDFECILDKRKKPLPYRSQSITPGKSPGIYWESDTSRVESSLPPESERIALEFLDVRAFCSNIPHLKGKSAMKKRHLEILGYRVIQVPYFEWNSMALSTKDARMDYLREHIFGAGKS
ncbi:FAST kinase domains 1 [Cricetulus griseus]